MREKRLDIDKLSSEAIFSAITSRGPGGQNVNKVASAAQLKWNVRTTKLLSEDEINIVLAKLARRLNSFHEVIVRSDEFRDLPRNKTRALEKLAILIEECLKNPKERKPTLPTRASKKRRLEKKARRGEIKTTRRAVKWND